RPFLSSICRALPAFHSCPPRRSSDLTLPVVGAVSFTLVSGVGLFTVMALGLAFTDVLVDAMMVENGRPRGLTGAFQSVQWACITDRKSTRLNSSHQIISYAVFCLKNR